MFQAREIEKRGRRSVPNLRHFETIVCLRYNGIHNSHRVPVPRAFRNLWISWLNLGTFLLLREFYKLQGKINPFFSKSFVHQRLREVFTIPGAFATPDV